MSNYGRDSHGEFFDAGNFPSNQTQAHNLANKQGLGLMKLAKANIQILTQIIVFKSN